jgi:hypothetical protein
MNPGIWRKFQDMLYHSARFALDAGVDVIDHWGLEESDVQYTDLLEDRFLSRQAKKRAACNWGGIIGMFHL